MHCKSGGKKHGHKRYKEIHNIAKIKLRKLKVETQQEDLGWKHTKSKVCAYKHNTRLVKILHSKLNYILVKTKIIMYNTYIV